jgi:hypothetical protein
MVQHGYPDTGLKSRLKKPMLKDDTENIRASLLHLANRRLEKEKKMH